MYGIRIGDQLRNLGIPREAGRNRREASLLGGPEQPHHHPELVVLVDGGLHASGVLSQSIADIPDDRLEEAQPTKSRKFRVRP